jgi:glutamate formiminotransferase
MAQAAVMECVPNVSEGRNAGVIGKLVDSLQRVTLLDCSSDADHNRSVLTFAGPPEAVLEAALNLAGSCFELLSLAKHEGVHPRTGVLDVLPFVPVAGISLDACAALAQRAARQMWDRFGVPSFLYEAAGQRPLEAVRRLAKAGGEPDIGSGRHLTAGAVAVGARSFLVAWNVWLESSDLSVAQSIATRIRFSSGGLPGVKALGLPLASRNVVQVSINSVDYEATPLHRIFAEIEKLAALAGVQLIGSELIGLIPQHAVDLSDGHDLRWMNWNPDCIFERRYSRGSVSHSYT